jgi:hypothetical protein
MSSTEKIKSPKMKDINVKSYVQNSFRKSCFLGFKELVSEDFISNKILKEKMKKELVKNSFIKGNLCKCNSRSLLNITSEKKNNINISDNIKLCDFSNEKIKISDFTVTGKKPFVLSSYNNKSQTKKGSCLNIPLVFSKLKNINAENVSLLMSFSENTSPINSFIIGGGLIKNKFQKRTLKVVINPIQLKKNSSNLSISSPNRMRSVSTRAVSFTSPDKMFGLNKLRHINECLNTSIQDSSASSPGIIDRHAYLKTQVLRSKSLFTTCRQPNNEEDRNLLPQPIFQREKHDKLKSRKEKFKFLKKEILVGKDKLNDIVGGLRQTQILNEEYLRKYTTNLKIEKIKKEKKGEI